MSFMHSVETPSMVDPSWNILYWGSKWIFQTVYWGACAKMLVATQWPMSVHLTSPHLPGFVCYEGLKAHWSYVRYACCYTQLWCHVIISCVIFILHMHLKLIPSIRMRMKFKVCFGKNLSSSTADVISGAYPISSRPSSVLSYVRRLSVVCLFSNRINSLSSYPIFFLLGLYMHNDIDWKSGW